jgi:hypothetical protein
VTVSPRSLRVALALWLVACGSALLCGSAAGEDVGAALSKAESRVEVAAAELRESEARVEPAESRAKASRERAAPAAMAARSANRRARALKHRLRARRLAAAARVSRIEDERREAAEEHDDTVSLGLGLALAALVAAGVLVCWDRFRGSPAVGRLMGLPVGQAVGLCVGGGLLAVIAGAVMRGGDGALQALGAALIALGFFFACALVVARHSALVRSGHSQPVLGRERWPRRVGRVAAGAMAALLLLGLGTAVFAGEGASSTVSAKLRATASGHAASTPALHRAERRAARLSRRASALVAAVRSDRRQLKRAQRQVRGSEARLSSAEGDIANYSRKLAALEAHDAPQVESSSECDPNYSGCLDPTASDYDCTGGSGDGPLYTGTVEVLGDDHYGLDADGDGIGCES